MSTIQWNNFDTLESYKALQSVAPVDLAAVVSGESGAERVAKYCVPMAAGLAYNFAAKAAQKLGKNADCIG